jgi:hypothetical protein
MDGPLGPTSWVIVPSLDLDAEGEGGRISKLVIEELQ